MDSVTRFLAILILFTFQAHAALFVSPQTEQAIRELTTPFAIPKMKPTTPGHIFIPHQPPPTTESSPASPPTRLGIIPLWSAGYPIWFTERVQHVFDCYHCQESDADQAACQAVLFEMLNPGLKAQVTDDIRSKMERIYKVLEQKVCSDKKDVFVGEVPVVDMPIVPVITPHLHPVPEPSTLKLLGLGFLSFILFYVMP